MSVLQLQVEVDSDIHPELHALLTALSRTESRAERLQQLATQGLIWEQLRLQARTAAPCANEPAVTSNDEALGACAAPTVASPLRDSSSTAAGRTRLPPAAVPVLWDEVDEQIRPVACAARPDNSRAALVPIAPTAHGPSSNERARAAPAPRRSRKRLLRMKEMGLFRNGPDD